MHGLVLFGFPHPKKNLRWIDCSGFPHITRHLRDHPHTPTRRAARPESSGTPRPRDLRASSARTFARGRSRAPSSPFSETRRHRDNRLASGKPSPRRPPLPRARISSRERPRVPREAALALVRTPRNRLDARMTVGTLLVRNHNALAKACLGGGFAFGFAYTNNTGTSPIRDAASAAGTSSPPRPKRDVVTFDRCSRATLARYDAATVATPSSARFAGASRPTAIIREKCREPPTNPPLFQPRAQASRPRRTSRPPSPSAPPARTSPERDV